MTELRPPSEGWDQSEVVQSATGDERPAAAWLAGALAAHLIIFAYVVARGFVSQPYSDMFDHLQRLFDDGGSGGGLTYLWSLHNGQHPVWVRVLTALDVKLFHGTALIFAGVSTLAVTLAAALIGYVLWRAVPVRGLGAAAALLSGMLIVSTINAVDCTQPINSVYAITFGLAVAAIVLFESPGWALSGRIGAAQPIALIAAFGATLGSAAGLAVWPVLALSAWRSRVTGWLLATAIVAGGFLIALYLWDSHNIATAQPAGGAVHHAVRMADYFLLYCSAPWSLMRILKPARLAIGAIAALVGVVWIARGPRRTGQAGRIERIGLDLIAFALITAAMAAIGRVDEDPEIAVPVRYAIFMSAFDVGVVCVLVARMTQDWPVSRGRAMTAALAVAALLLGQQVAAGASLIRSSAHVRAVIAAFDAGQRTPEMLRLIHPDLGFAARVTKEYRRRGLYR
jgi:hypothetical protein